MTEEDNVAKQAEEMDVLRSIYGHDWQLEDEAMRMFRVVVQEGAWRLQISLTFPTDYPSHAPPSYVLHSHSLTTDDRQNLSARLGEIYLENLGESVVYLWVECIREYLREKTDAVAVAEAREETEHVEIEEEKSCLPVECEMPCITHGEVIVDRKSTFQGHAAKVVSAQQVRQVLAALYENRKIANATHNIYAYRILKEDTKSHLHDCNDDGETHAGSRLLHLLELLNCCNVLVVVSRWYGGIHLGPDRFKHINNAARLVLEQIGACTASKTETRELCQSCEMSERAFLQELARIWPRNVRPWLSKPY